jgi:hypothetical protein
VISGGFKTLRICPYKFQERSEFAAFDIVGKRVLLWQQKAYMFRLFPQAGLPFRNLIN